MTKRILAALAACLFGSAAAHADSTVPSLPAATSLTSAATYLAQTGSGNNQMGFLTSVFGLSGGALTINPGGITNSMLVSPTISVNGTPCTLGSSCSPSGGGGLPSIDSGHIIGNATGSTATAAETILAAGSGIDISAAGGVITITNTSSAGTVGFSGITPGTNTGALVMGAGGSLTATGGGTIVATAAPVTGLTGAGANVLTFLQVPTSANLAAALTNETGSGAAVFANSPTLSGPTINGGILGAGAWTVSAGTPTRYLGFDSGNNAVTGTPAGGSGNMTGSGATTTNNILCSNNTGSTLTTAVDCGYSTSTFLARASNLTDLANVATARNNLLLATSSGTPTRYLGLDASNNVVTGTPAGGGSVSITAADTSIVVSPSPLTGTGTIAVGGPSHLTTFTAGTVPMGAGTSPFAASEITDVALGGVTIGTPTGGQKGAGTINMTGCFINNVPCAAGSSVAWSAITGGTNTSATMVVGTGASLAASGSGAITATALPVSGLTGAGANVLTFLATPSSANFAAALTDETGSGAAVFGTTPTLTTPVINGGTFQTSQPWTVTAGTPTVYLGLDASSHLVSGTPAGGGSGLSGMTTGGLGVAGSASTITSSLNPTSDNVAIGISSAWNKAAIPNCTDSGGNHLNYATGGTFSCGTSSSGGGSSLTVTGGGTTVTATTAENFGTGFSVTGTTGTAGIDLTTVPNPQAGSSYTINATDKNKTVNRTSGSAMTDTLPAVGTTGFGTGYGFSLCTAAGSDTLTSSSNINGAGSLSIPAHTCVAIADLDNTTYSAFVPGTGGGGTGANPTATAGPTANNGSATTFMRSDASPAVQLGSSSQAGLLQVDNQTIVAVAGIISVSTANHTFSANHTVAATDMGGVAVMNGSSLTVTIPAISSTVLAANMGVAICNEATSLVTISSTPTINNYPSTVIPQYGCIMLTSNGTSLDAVAMGTASIKEAALSWGPGQNLSTAAVPFAMDVTGARHIISISCNPEVVAGGAATIDVWEAASGTALGSGTKLTSTSCNANSGATTNQTGLLGGTTLVAAGSRMGIVGTGFGTTNGSGVITVKYQ